MPSYTLLPKQREFLHAKDGVSLDIAIYQGGYGSGKTWVGSLLGLLLTLKYPGILGLVAAKTYPMVRDTTLRTYKEHLDMLGLTYELKSEHQNGHMVFPNGSEILFRGLDNPEKVKSLNLGFVQVEEISQIDESDFNMLLSRLRQSGIPRYRLFGHTNPQANKGWIYENFVENNQSTDNVHYRRVVSASNENTFLPEHYVTSMQNQFDEEYYRINVLGQDGDYTAGLVNKSWNFANIDNSIEYDKDKRLYLTCDFNVDPMCWAIAHRYNNEYHFIDELCIENTNIIETAARFADKYGKHEAGIIITGDASGNNRTDAGARPQDTRYKILLSELSNLGVRNVALDVNKANPYIENRVESWNAMVCNSAGVRRVKVHPRCKWLIFNCDNLKYIPGSSVIWEPTPRDIERNSKMKFVKHIWDAASYLVEKYDPARKIQPPTGHKQQRVVTVRSGASTYGG